MKELSIRASSLPDLMVCSPSVLNPEGWPDVEQEIKPAALGTAVHEFAERIVATNTYDTAELEGRFPDKADQERANLLISNFFTIWQEAKQVMTDPKTELEHEATLVNDDNYKIKLTGHIDLCQVNANGAIILDYKTGRSHEDHYHQIAGYAYLLWDYAGRPAEFDVQVSVVYLEDLSIQNYSFSADGLDKWQKDVYSKVKDTRYVVSRKCGVCGLNASCPTAAADRDFTFKFLMGDDAQKGKVSWMSMTPEERGVLIDRMYVIKKGLEKVEISLKAAMAGQKKSINRLDIGKGMVYERVKMRSKVLNTRKALPLLRKRFSSDLLDELYTLKLDDVLALVAKFAPRGKKVEARNEWLAKLAEAGAIEESSWEKFSRRPKNELQHEEQSDE